jgi:hypothetical protein
MKTTLIALAGLLTGALLTAVSLLANAQDVLTRLEKSESARADELIAAYNQGRKDALSLSPVSWDLDEACLTLWTRKTFK